MSKRFVRVDTHRLLKLGKGRPKLQKWRRPRGKHNKTRLKRFGYPLQPGIGFGTPRTQSGKVQGLIPILITNISQMKDVTKNNIIIVARRLGARKKLEIIKKASEMNVKIENVGGKK